MPKEANIQKRTLDTLNADPNVIAITTHGSQFSKRGTPDIIGSRNGHAFAIELKQPGGHVNALQPYRLKQWAAGGAWVGIADTVEDAVRISKGN